MTQSVARRRPYAARVPIEQRREQLLDAAIAIIVRDGYDGVSIDAIAREAGVTRPVVYGAYDGLGPLLLALLDRQQVRAMAQLLRALPDQLPDQLARQSTDDVDAARIGEVVDASVNSLVEQLRTDPVTWRPILLAPQATPDVVRERIDADRQRVVGHLATLIEQALPAADGEVLGHAVVAVLEHFGRLLLEDPDRFATERLVRAVHTVIDPLLPR